MSKLTKAQAEALEWLWPTSRRQWLGRQYCTISTPTIAALDALVRKGLAKKQGSAGWSIYFTMTDEGRAARAALSPDTGSSGGGVG